SAKRVTHLPHWIVQVCSRRGFAPSVHPYMGISFLYLAGNVASNRLDSFFGNVRIFQQHGDGVMAQIVHTEALQISRGDHAQPSSLERGLMACGVKQGTVDPEREQVVIRAHRTQPPCPSYG